MSLQLGDRAELLGAIYGDGYIQKRGKLGRKVAVTVGSKYPEWRDRVKWLVEQIFGRVFIARKKNEFFEFYVTTYDVRAIFGIESKYLDDAHKEGMTAPPSWIDESDEYTRRFMLGLVETDGMFLIATDKRSADGEWARFSFAQKDKRLIDWFADKLRAQNIEPVVYWAEQASVWYVAVNRQDQVARLGEWLGSIKWQYVLKTGFEPQVGRRAKAVKESIRWPEIADEEQDEWRRLREAGASIGIIANHFRRATNTVWVVVRDIVPTKVATAADLGLTVRLKFPKKSKVSSEEVEKWREEIRAGASATAVAKKYGRTQPMVTDATRDLLN